MSDNPYDGVNEHDPEQDQEEGGREDVPVAFEIKVPVLDISSSLTLKQSVGEGTYGDELVKLQATLPGYYPMVLFRDKTYMVNTNEIVRAVCETVVAAEAERGSGK